MASAEKRTTAYFWVEYPKGIVPRQAEHDTERRISSASSKKLRYEIPDQMVIGREEGVALQIDHPRLLKRHFRVAKKKQSYKFRTYPRSEVRHNGVVSKEGILAPGDTVEIGPIRFTFHVETVEERPERSTEPSTADVPASDASAVLDAPTESDSRTTTPVEAAAGQESGAAKTTNEDADTLPASPNTEDGVPAPATAELGDETPSGDQKRGSPLAIYAVVGLLCAGLGYVFASLPKLLDTETAQTEERSSVDRVLEHARFGPAGAPTSGLDEQSAATVSSTNESTPASEPNTAAESPTTDSLPTPSTTAAAGPSHPDEVAAVVSAVPTNVGVGRAEALPPAEQAPTTEGEVQIVPLPPTSQPTTRPAPKSLAELENTRAKQAALAWERRKIEIARHYKLRDSWNQQGRAVAELAGYLGHEEWAIRAMGVIVLVANKDSRSLIQILPALTDAHPIVQAVALKSLLDVPIHRFRRAADGQEIVEAVIGLLSQGKLLQRYSLELLSNLARTRLTSRKAVTEWWQQEQPRFTGTSKPFDLTQFTSGELQRYREEMGIAQGGTRVIPVPDELFPTKLLELRTHGLDLVICLDISGSMGSVLAEAVKEVETLGAILSSIVGNCRIGLVTYRDAVATTLPLTRDWKHFKEILSAQVASGGGEEVIERALAAALSRQMKWRPRASNHIVVVGDEPARDPQECLKLAARAKSFGIPIHAIFPSRVVRQIEAFVEESGGQTTRLANEHEFLASILSLVFGKELEQHMDLFIEKYRAIVVDLNWLGR